MSKKNEYQGHLIREVYPDSIAEAMEIEPGDVLLRINNQKIEDVFDYRYMIKDEYVEVLIRKPDGEEWLLEIEKEYDDDLGVEFENGLMMITVPAVTSAFSVLSIRCRRECVRHCISKMMIPVFLSCREIISL